MEISIHSTTRVETPNRMISCGQQSRFQSTPPRGWRRPGDSGFCGGTAISIHSTTRVETFPPPLYYVPHTDFNPLHHEGGDLHFFFSWAVVPDFNPLHHEGGDAISISTFPCIPDFNPLHHEGGDTYHAIATHATNGFQSTPPRGWRLISSVYLSHFHLFQSTPPRGWRLTAQTISLWIATFQSTPPRGWRLKSRCRANGMFHISIHSTTRVETSKIIEAVYTSDISIHSTTRVETYTAMGISDRLIFQSTPPRGWRPGYKITFPNGGDFNPLHHEGGDLWSSVVRHNL